MARRRRLISNQGAYHVYNRAELGQPIFETDAAKQVFLETLLRTTHRFGWDLPAYAIMTNHFHLVVTTPRGNLSEGMHGLQSAFANKHKISQRMAAQAIAIQTVADAKAARGLFP